MGGEVGGGGICEVIFQGGAMHLVTPQESSPQINVPLSFEKWAISVK